MEHVGKIIVLEGLDKSGKTTQAHLLQNYLNDRYPSQTELFSFPDYSTKIGEEIRSFLDGKVQYNAETKHMLLSANRWEKKENILNALRSGKTIILNRYYQSNLVYGVSKGLKLDWLLSLDEGLPKADLVIVIDIKSDTMVNRSKNSTIDTFEKDRELIRKVKRTYRVLAKKFKWHVVDGEKSIDDVHSQVLRIVRKTVKI